MAGFFGLFDFTKEGKGVYPDEPPKGPFATFFAILGRKFWKICSINMLYILLSLPVLVLAFFSSIFVIQVLFPQLNVSALEEYEAQQLMLLFVMAAFLLTGLALIIAGPVHAGVTYVLRNYSREEHAFIWMDFKEHARKNLKQSLVSSILSFVITMVFAVNFAFYSLSPFLGNGIVRILLQTIIFIAFILWCIMQMYLYPMMVTFDLKLKQLYKNCLLFAILRLPWNIMIFVCSLIILLVVPFVLIMFNTGLTFMLAFAWYLFLAFGLNLLMTNFFVYRGLDKYMLQRNQEADAAAASPSKNENEAEDAKNETEPENKGDDQKPNAGKEKGGLQESPSGIKP